MKDLKVLLTGAGAPGAPGILRCYKNNGERKICVLGIDARAQVPTRLQLDAFRQGPKASDADFIDFVLDLAAKETVDIIQPIVTRELEAFAGNAGRFEEKGIAVCVPPAATLQIANDKGLLLDFLQENGFLVPQYRKVCTAQAFIDACRQLGYPDTPVCFKPCKANGSRGFRILDEKKNLAKLLFEEKPNSTYMDFRTAVSVLEQMETMPELLVMEFMPGEEYSVDMLLDHGKALYTMPRRRQQMNGGISVDCILENNKEVIDYCRDIAQALMLHGNIGIQVRRAADGAIKILEINPRLQGSTVCCAAAGVNLPYYGLKLALGEPVPEAEIRWGTRMQRYWGETYYGFRGQPFTY